jgi:hypothetical protein
VELSLSSKLEDALTESQTLREQLGASEDARNRQATQVRQLEQLLARTVEDTDSRAKSRYAELERELEEKSAEFEAGLAEMQQKSEEQLSQLKTFFEIERDRLERRL